MKTIVPDYYPHFSCIAGGCLHSCCIGWEIDIDPDTLRRYQQQEGEIGERLRQNIDITPDGACFHLQGAEARCPFLNQDGLCDLILTLGEDSLCQICTDHPRFRNFFSDRTETGLGLCCEEACRLILSWNDPVRLIELADDGEVCDADPDELQLLSLRHRLTALMQDRSRSVEARVDALLASVGAHVSDFVWLDWLPFFLSLERLDEHWADELQWLENASCSMPVIPSDLQIPLEQLMVYLLFRHLPSALDDGMERERILLCVLMWLTAAHLTLHAGSTMQVLAEFCRLLSSEWEYSEDNIAAILNKLAQSE